MRTRWMLCLLLLLLMMHITAQANDDLTAQDLEISTEIDAFGLETSVLSGTLTNNGQEALASIEVIGELYDDDDELIGEGYGFVVDECGTALLDTPLQPGQTVPFSATVDRFEDGDVARIDISADGIPEEPEVLPDVDISAAVSRVSDREVVLVEWADNSQTLRYGVGCDSAVFTTYDWFQYSLSDESTVALDAHPNAGFITEAFIAQTGINQITQSREQDPTLFDTSFLTFPTQSQRIIYQTDIHTVITAERDGSFKRVVHEPLSRFSLQGFNWSPLGNFVAYYFGAFGEPVRYFTGSAAQGRISAELPNNTPSQTVPGVVNDARRVIISGTFAGSAGEPITGYWLSSVLTNQRELLFEVDDLPGNNYPAPAYYRKDANTRYIYVVRPIEGIATLQCFYREGDELTTLTELPLFLDTDERAWAWLSPDFNTLAISADGVHGGLWLVDLTAFDVCQ